MKRQLSKQKSEKPDAKRDSSIAVRRLFTPSEILSYLNRERNYSAVAIAHLEADFSEVSNWFVATDHDNFALCLISRSTSPTYMFTLGNASALDYILRSVPLPGNVYVTCQPHHLNIIEGYYDIGQRYILKRMAVNRESFIPSSEEAIRLRSSHTKELSKLYKSHGSNTFSAGHIGKRVYYGIWRDGQLVAAAGTHIISPSHGIACVGNVLTHASYRNQGLATICTSAVTAELLAYCTEVVLNVEPENLHAIRAYASLGYKEDCMVVEAFGRRQGFVGDIITNLCRKFRFGEKQQEGVKVDG